tara:strand:+ start:5140 stop:5574 length:435 start_codon:yes stop_codon:yes gene_type:complete
MKLSSTAGMQGIGWATETFVGKASEAITKGMIVECLLATLSPDDDQSIAISNGSGIGIYGVALEDIASGERGLCALSGKVKIIAGDTAAAGVPIMPNNAGKSLEHAGDDNTVAVGFQVELGVVGELKTCIFNGFCPQRTGDFAA